MSAKEIPLNSQLVFQDDPLRFNCGPPQLRVGGDPGSKTTTRELTGFIDDKLFSSSSNSSAAAASDHYFSSHQGGPEFPRNMFRENRDWNGDGNGSSDDESDGEDDDEDDDDVDDDDVDTGSGDRDTNEVQALVAVDNTISNNNNNGNSDKINNNSTTTTASNASNTGNSGNIDKMGNNGKLKHHSFGTSGEVVALKDGGGNSIGQTGNNVVTIAEPDGEMYYSQYLQGTEGSRGGGKDMAVENGCGFGGRKEVSSFSSESGESLRTILSDPVTGSLMDDAMILPCGHSFGAGGVQHIIRMKTCYTCSQSVSEDSIAPNLSLQAAVQAFRREEELQFYRSSKRRRERFDQDKGGFGDSTAMDGLRGRGVQFPFAVTDRVIIKGNKRTPQRFVGREAVVTTQCLNGWYVVKTLDNAESVKLQYRSLAKVSDGSSSKVMSSKIGPNWL